MIYYHDSTIIFYLFMQVTTSPIDGPHHKVLRAARARCPKGQLYVSGPPPLSGMLGHAKSQTAGTYMYHAFARKSQLIYFLHS
jgi:hypothetical protein